MSHFWQVSATLWLNPQHIAYVEDYPESRTPALWVTMVAIASGMDRTQTEEYTLELEGAAREKLLAYLVRETEPPPAPAPAASRG